MLVYNIPSILLYNFRRFNIIHMKRDIKKVFSDEERREGKRFTSHNWSTTELQQLKDLQNHKIVHDKYNYVWMKYIDGLWTRQSLQDYDNYKTAYSHLMFWQVLWSQEYNKRILYLERKRIQNECRAWEEIVNILSSPGIKTSSKVKMIFELLPDLRKNKIAELTGMSPRQVDRILKTI